MPEDADHLTDHRDRAVRLLITAGLRSDIAKRVALTFAPGPRRTPDDPFATIDFVCDAAVSLSALGAMLLLRTGVSPVTWAPEALADAEQLWDSLKDALERPVVETDPAPLPSQPRLQWW